MQKLLIDACVSPAVGRQLRADGHDVIFVNELPADPGDRAILDLASAESRVVVTIDSDFGALVFRDGATRVGVLRLREAPPSIQAARAKTLIDAHGDALASGAFVVDDGGAGRISRR